MKRAFTLGFTLIEIMIVIAIIAVIASIAIPNLRRSRIAANETATVANMRAWMSAQATFQRTDYYDIGQWMYANSDDGMGYTDLHEVPASVTGKVQRLDLIDATFARASRNAKSPYLEVGSAKSGYLFNDITAGPGGAYSYDCECGLYGVPAKYDSSGRKEFVIDYGTGGTVYWYVHGSTREPQTAYPDLSSGWLVIN